jgi:hypothetical protein
MNDELINGIIGNCANKFALLSVLLLDMTSSVGSALERRVK